MTKKDTTECEKCGKTVELNSLKPVFKKEFSKAEGKPDIPLDILLAGGWLGKTLEGMACPNCGEILARTSKKKQGERSVHDYQIGID